MGIHRQEFDVGRVPGLDCHDAWLDADDVEMHGDTVFGVVVVGGVVGLSEYRRWYDRRA